MWGHNLHDLVFRGPRVVVIHAGKIVILDMKSGHASSLTDPNVTRIYAEHWDAPTWIRDRHSVSPVFLIQIRQECLAESTNLT